MSILGQWKRVHLLKLCICKQFKDGKANANTKTLLPYSNSLCDCIIDQIKVSGDKHVLAIFESHMHVINILLITKIGA